MKGFHRLFLLHAIELFSIDSFFNTMDSCTRSHDPHSVEESIHRQQPRN